MVWCGWVRESVLRVFFRTLPFFFPFCVFCSLFFHFFTAPPNPRVCAKQALKTNVPFQRKEREFFFLSPNRRLDSCARVACGGGRRARRARQRRRRRPPLRPGRIDQRGLHVAHQGGGEPGGARARARARAAPRSRQPSRVLLHTRAAAAGLPPASRARA